ncbi:unnamed protein product [Musa hybrid cultivar]
MCLTWSVVSVEIGSHNYRSPSSLGGDISISIAQRGPAATTFNGFVEALPASSVPGMCTSVSACSAIRVEQVYILYAQDDAFTEAGQRSAASDGGKYSSW